MLAFKIFQRRNGIRTAVGPDPPIPVVTSVPRGKSNAVSHVISRCLQRTSGIIHLYKIQTWELCTSEHFNS